MWLSDWSSFATHLLKWGVLWRDILSTKIPLMTLSVKTRLSHLCVENFLASKLLFSGKLLFSPLGSSKAFRVLRFQSRTRLCYSHCTGLNPWKSFNHQVIVSEAGIRHIATQWTEIWFIDQVILHEIHTRLLLATWGGTILSDHHWFTAWYTARAWIRHSQGCPGAQGRRRSSSRVRVPKVAFMENKSTATQAFTSLSVGNGDS